MFECPYCKREFPEEYAIEPLFKETGWKRTFNSGLAKANFNRHVNACTPQTQSERLKRKAVMDVHTCAFCRIQNQKFSKVLNMDKCTSDLGCRCILTKED